MGSADETTAERSSSNRSGDGKMSKALSVFAVLVFRTLQLFRSYTVCYYMLLVHLLCHYMSIW